MDRKIGLSSLAARVQRLVTPGIPLDRVVGVLAEVGARLVRQMVHGSRCYGQRWGVGPHGPRTAYGEEMHPVCVQP